MVVYNLIIGLKSRPNNPIIKDNLSKNELIRDIIVSYNKGEDFRCGDEIVSYFDISNIKITESEKPFIPSLFEPTPQRNFADRWQQINQMKDVTYKFIKNLTQKKKEITKETTPLSKNMFIVHGRDQKPIKELKAMLKEFGLNPIVLHEQPSGSRTIVEKLEKYSDVGYAFVILTPDDVGCFRFKIKDITLETKEQYFTIQVANKLLKEYLKKMFGPLKPRARQNVVLEFGYFIGLLGRDKVCCLYKGDVELPSDMAGIVYIPFEESVEESRGKIIRELEAVGYEIKF